MRRALLAVLLLLPALTWAWWGADATALLAFAGCATLSETARTTGPENFFDLIERSADWALIMEAA